MDYMQKQEKSVVGEDDLGTMKSTDQTETNINQGAKKPFAKCDDDNIANQDTIEIELNDSVAGYRNFVAAQAEPDSLGQLKTFQAMDRNKMSANDEDASIFVRSGQKVQIAQHVNGGAKGSQLAA